MTAEIPSSQARGSETAGRLEVRVDGTVQGVGFRMFVERQAKALGISGWVQNHTDGSVRVVAEGKVSALEEFLTSVKRGPAGSVVRECAAVWGKSLNNVHGFHIHATGRE